ncbi:ankyrin repeat domain-containing protein 7-like [Erpetoichthys calabaricus]|uniref:ankyrin repeat domain-containing protein 7-like n=1 Tax=Erpetoichthys calabaricus TaxID=27687 RepID=UPI0022346A16|nr:ankyrin repeat domain-containing protein 7-like [Erpetoichthys calabaricus]
MKKFLHYLGLKDNELHAAASVGDLDRLEQLLNRKGKKANVNKADKENRTLLHVACAGGHSDVVSFLVENQAELDPIDDEHQTPLIMAVQHMREECVLILLKNGANPWLKDINGDTALHHAALVSELPLGQTPAGLQCGSGHPQTRCLELLLKQRSQMESEAFLMYDSELCTSEEENRSREAEQKPTDGMGLMPFNGMKFGKMETSEEFFFI